MWILSILYTGIKGLFGGSKEHIAINLIFAVLITYLTFLSNLNYSRVKNALLKLGSTLLTLGFLFCLFYIIFLERAELIEFKASLYNRLDVLVSIFLVFAFLVFTKMTSGWVIPIVGVIASLYMFFGNYLGGFFYHPKFGFQEIFIGWAYDNQGMLGTILMVIFSFVSVFIFLGAYLKSIKTTVFFADIATLIFGGAIGGPAKIAVVTSSIFGSISGSAIANVLTTGAYTIPLMKRAGFSDDMAGAVEAVSSSGGQLMPPAMGTVAFMMANFIGIPYWRVCKAAFIPAIFYYSFIFIEVHMYAKAYGIKGIERTKKGKDCFFEVIKLFKKGWYHFVPIALLIYFLGGIGMPPLRSCTYTIIVMVIIYFFEKVVKKRDERNDSIKVFVEASREAAISITSIGFLCGVIGIVVSVMSVTGLGLKFANLIPFMAKGSFPTLLILAMLGSLLLGIGLPTVACYAFLALVMAPVLINEGANIISAHLFVLYFGIISLIVPPVALASITAAKLAGANLFKTSFKALFLGLGGFLVPYAFIYDTHLVWEGSGYEILLSFIISFIGLFFIAFGVGGMLSKKLGRLEIVKSIILTGFGFHIFMPMFGNNYSYRLAEIFIVILAFFILFLVRKKRIKNQI